MYMYIYLHIYVSNILFQKRLVQNSHSTGDVWRWSFDTNIYILYTHTHAHTHTHKRNRYAYVYTYIYICICTYRYHACLYTRSTAAADGKPLTTRHLMTCGVTWSFSFGFKINWKNGFTWPYATLMFDGRIKQRCACERLTQNILEARKKEREDAR